MGPYLDRRQAGVELAKHLEDFRDRPEVVVLGLPRGGVPVAHEVASELGVALDVFIVRKLGVPGRPELAMGAIASGGVRVMNEKVIAWLGVSKELIDDVVHHELVELDRRDQVYRAGRAALDVRDRVVILIDDGLATGSTMKAAVEAVRAQHPARIVVAVPVGAASTCREIAAVADQIVCPRAPENFAAVGEWYHDFLPTSDEEVRGLLRAHSETSKRS